MVCAIAGLEPISEASGKIHLRCVEYIGWRCPAKPEVLLAIIADMPHSVPHVYGWVWRREYWEEFLRLLAEQAEDDTPLTADDVVALIKLRLDHQTATQQTTDEINAAGEPCKHAWARKIASWIARLGQMLIKLKLEKVR